jgi:branched-subunit amino acid transport protein
VEAITANLTSAFAVEQGMWEWLALIAASIGTYVCRAVGVMLSGRVSQESEFFRWLSAVTYAMVAALTIRLIFLPVGMLSTVPLYLRLIICAIAVGVMLINPSRRLVPALLIGTLLMVAVGIVQAL